MIIEYHRPDTIEEALRLLSRREPITHPLGGGTILNGPSEEDYAVVDLQALGLNKIYQQGQTIFIGATATLEELLHSPEIQPALKSCIQLECTYNLRQMRTVAGTVVAANGRSSLATALLALDAQLKIEPDGGQISFGNLLPLRDAKLARRLIVQLSISLNVSLSYHYVARTPADLPIVCVAAARWPSGRLRLALGGYGNTPALAMDGSEPEGAEESVKIIYGQADDQWASAEYRREIATILARRCINELIKGL